MNFENKVCLITGASSGIGAAAAEYLSKLGASVALVGRNETNLKKVCEKCTIPNQAKPLAIVADVNKDSSKIIELTINTFGRIDVLINNAGIGVPSNIFTNQLTDYDNIMTTNVRSVYQLTTLAVPHLIESKGNIVNVSSLAGIRSYPNALIYCMSKAALDQFTKCVSLELAPKGVRVNSVNPAVIRTEFHENNGVKAEDLEQFLEQCKKDHALGRIGEVDEVAYAIAFLASEQASFMTGVLLPVDGGKANMCPR
ncbi:uncharacterized oxidoreductase TM_0325-like [Bradysia coprophila]|uniref:uncharacterized oxidoreductase TM_0325-like n=1 Tax=Bradysia coprophila TaxID=38358 RepID=UPI00187D7219|nr:uncharacterized oxidoreductase TM_0325-like [Bradysia coprophila]